MTSSRRILKGGDVPANVVSWHAPEVSATKSGRAPAVEAPPQQDPVAILEQARRDGFKQGHAEGVAAGMADIQQNVALLQQMLAGLARPLDDLDQQFEAEVLALVKAVARQLLGREMALDPSHLIELIRSGLDALPMASRAVQIRLHPEDAVFMREQLQVDNTNQAWTLESDPLMERGGCRLVTESAQVDNRLEPRLNQLMAALLEGERVAPE